MLRVKWLIIGVLVWFVANGLLWGLIGSPFSALGSVAIGSLVGFDGYRTEKMQRDRGLTTGARPKLVVLWTIAGVAIWFGISAVLWISAPNLQTNLSTVITSLLAIAVGIAGYNAHKNRVSSATLIR